MDLPPGVDPVEEPTSENTVCLTPQKISAEEAARGIQGIEEIWDQLQAEIIDYQLAEGLLTPEQIRLLTAGGAIDQTPK
jgi:hypothetical protein